MIIITIQRMLTVRDACGNEKVELLSFQNIEVNVV